MLLQVKCPNSACGSVNVIADHLVGGNTRCSACGATFSIAAPPTLAHRAAPSTILPPAAAKQTLGGASSAAGANQPAAFGSPQRIGRFEIRARLGAGAFGIVYRAYDPQLQREVALKVMHPETLNHPERVERFQREARSAAQLRHANIVPVYEIGQDGGQYFIASAYIAGQTLYDALDGQPMQFTRAARIVRDLAEAVAQAHRQGVVHRDLKPANVLLDEHDSPQLVDFGLSARQETRQEKENRLTRLGAVLGTPAYMAPEQASGQTGEVQPAADQYSLGVILYELLCGEPPFNGPPALVIYNVIHTEPATPRSLNAAVPPELERICRKAMARRPEDRYANCQALADALRRRLEGNATPVRAVEKEATTVLAPRKSNTTTASAVKKEATAVLAPKKDATPVLTRKKKREAPRNAWLLWIILATAGCLLAAVLAVLGGGGIWWMTHKKPTVEQPLAQEKEKRDALERQPVQTKENKKTEPQPEPKKPDPQPEPMRTEPQPEPKKPDPQPEPKKPEPPPPSLPLTVSVDLGGGVNMEFMLIPKGKFLMGLPKNEPRMDKEEQHEVEITKPFYLAKYPVTQQQYQALMKNNPSWFQAGKGGANKVQGLDTKQFPVETVSWNDAQAFCKKMRDNDQLRRKFQLPTEAEWEYACRAGTTTPFYFGSVLNGKEANCNGNAPYGTTDKGPYKERTTKVGEYGENKWGLCDMHGNVWQWCEDYYGPYEGLPREDPLRSIRYSDERRVQRGGSWGFSGGVCRAAHRGFNAPAVRNDHVGFRVSFRLD
jgi:formylglycine-generating enzyme required for sulfatase activity/serine/threonine protein kinase